MWYKLAILACTRIIATAELMGFLTSNQNDAYIIVASCLILHFRLFSKLGYCVET